MGAGAHGIFGRWRQRKHAPTHPPVLTPERARAERWVQRYGAPVLLLAWLPVVGDPLCAVAGWLRLPFWSCVVYIAIGKFGRYVALVWALRWVITPT
jgi:membrane protein YqaA with SNARE-associated domain